MPEEQTLLLWVFACCLLVGLSLDLLVPLRRNGASRWYQRLNNVVLMLINHLLSRLLIPGGLVAVAYWSSAQQLGLLTMMQAPGWLMLLAGVLWLDFIAYGLHRVSHRLPWLWRLHRLHHSDLEVDVTTEFRHHPFEALLSLAVYSLAIVLGGLTAEAVMTYFLLSIPIVIISHANWLWPRVVDRWLRLLVVTPAMHRIHHSAWQPETDSNYGIVFPWWDRLLGTYRHEPRESYREMTLGLERFRGVKDQVLPRLLLNPFE